MKPLFMWAGGKTKMLKKYEPYLPESFDKYVEPFFGAGAMFLWAYAKNPEATFVINDINESIMSIYKAVKDDVETFIEEADSLSREYIALPKGDTDKELERRLDKNWEGIFAEDPSRRHYYYMMRQRHAYEYQDWSSTKEAATLYFLMKTGFNGIWQVNKNTNNRFGTPCGLLKQDKVVYDKDNVREWSKMLQRCDIMTGDFSETLNKVDAETFVFMDPPYRGCFTQYGTDFDDDVQMSVIKYLNASVDKGAFALMSNRDTGDGFFEKVVGDNKMAYFDVTYTAGRRKKVSDGYEAKKATEILMIGSKTND